MIVNNYKTNDMKTTLPKRKFEKFLVLGLIFFLSLPRLYAQKEMPEVSNPDSLPYPIELTEPVVIQEYVDSDSPQIKSAAFSAMPLSLMKSATISSLTPGEVVVNKTATPVPGKVNTWEVKLRIEGRDNIKTSDIVLVIDRSGSMNGNRLTKAKNAAKQFVNTLLTQDSNTRIALVSFAGNVSSTNFKDYGNKQTLINAINALNASGGTFTQAGIKQAQTLLNSPNSTADYKNIVLLSDGVPTYSYKLNEPDDYLINYPGYGKQTSANAPISAYTYTESPVGSGSDMRYRYYNDWGTSNDKYYNHGNSTIAEAGFAKNAGSVVYTIALEAGNDGTNVLNATASPNKNYTSNSNDLNNIFQEIAGSIKSSVREASVSDPMGMGFTVLGTAQDIHATQGTPSFNASTNTLFWEVGNLTHPVSPGSDIKYAQLTYRIVITNDILEADDSNGLYYTNGDAQVNYTDGDNVSQTLHFPRPKVNPVFVIVKKTVLHRKHGTPVNDPVHEFQINISDNNGQFNETVELMSNEEMLLTTLRDEGSYSVEETGVLNANASLDDYTINYEINGSSGSDFTITQTSEDKIIEVKNQPANHIPEGKDDNITTGKNTPILSEVRSNDILSEDGGNVWTLATEPQFGELSLNTDGSYYYVPEDNFTGEDSFTYFISDADADRSSATVTITVSEEECSGCNSNDFQFEQYFLGDEYHNPLEPTCSSGSSVDAYIWLQVTGSASKYSLFVSYDLTITDPVTGEFSVQTIEECLYRYEEIPGDYIQLSAINWTCGSIVEISNFSMSWKQRIDLDCSWATPKCMCDDIPRIVNAPLSVNFKYAACYDGTETTATFTSAVTGGDGNYSYSWNFADGSTSNETNPTHAFTGVPGASYNVTLAITDGENTSSSKTIQVTIPNELSLTANKTDILCDGTPGTIDLTVNGGTPGYTYSWEGPNGYSSSTEDLSGLTENGIYIITVTDLFNCTQTTQVEVEFEECCSLDVACPTDWDKTVNCSNDIPVAATTETVLEDLGFVIPDTYCGTLVISSLDSPETYPTCNGTVTRTYTISDDNNSVQCIQVFTIEDTTDPTWTVEPSDMTSVACDPATNATAFENWLASFSGTDECGTATVTHNSTGLSDGCGATGTETVTFTLTDECGNDITKDATFTIIDDTDPTWTVEPSDMTSVACDPATNATAFENWLASFSGTDECGTATVTHNSTGLSDGCGATGTETVTFTLTDECGNDITKDATFTIIDDTDPTWTVEPSDMTSVACDPATNATAFENWLTSFSGTDECGTATVTHNSTGLSDGCGATGTETVTFTLTDECGNDITKDATFTIIDDTDPTWTVEPSDMTSVACDPATNATAFENWLASFSGTDECGTATVTHNSTGLSDGCGATGTETVTFTLTDECGNDITKDATFTIIDNTDPTWTVEPSDMTSVACDPATNATAFENWLASFSGTDECGTATVTHNSTGLSDGCGATGTETVTFTLTDECGNDITKDATFTIIDNTDPTWTVEPSDMTSVACDPATNATAFENWLASFSGTDECGTATVTHNSTGLSDGCGATGTETVTFTLTDECGNDITKDATFTIIDDTDPTWTVEPSDMTSVACDPATNATAFENWLASFSGTDECGTATVTHNSTGLSDGCGATGTETVTFTLTDECGNDITKDATFTIIDDTDPTWTVEPSDMTSVACDPATNATAFENWLTSFSGTDECGTATVTHNSTGLSDGCGATGTETVTFTLTDECGNDITKDATFTIIDDTDPTWTVEPSDMTSVACDPATNATAFENWLASFSGTDECGTATVTHNSTGLSDGCGATGTETVTFTLTDECGNDITKDATFTIIDNTDPTWTVEPSDMTSVACDPATNATAFENWLASFSGTDECGTATVTHNSTGLSDGCGATGTETVTFTLTDECGNDITKDATFTIIDNTDPTWTVEPSDMTSVACDPATNATAFENWLASFSGTDECGTATVTHNSTGLSDGCGATGTETVTFTLTDECGNDITKDATFTIIDDTDPTWTVEPSDMTSVACDPATNATAFENWLTSFSGTDECGTATVTHNSTGLSDGCGATGTETVTFTLTDECGNDITKDATFTIIDDTDPTWTVEPSDMTSVACDPATNATAFENWLASFSGTDECGTATVTHNSTGLSDGCGATGTETVTFTLTDECGNDITKDATFTIIDDTDPTWTVEPSDMTSVACDPATNATAFENWLASFSGTDECGTATVTHNSTGLSDGCGATGTETVTFTLTDECGNDITKDATFTIIDDTDPTWTVEPSDMTSVACDPATNATAFENWLASFSGTDECGTATVTHNSTGLSDGCGATGTETVTFTLTDECGNDITKDATFTIIDNTDPTWTVEPSDMTSVACDPATNATAFENWLASFSGTDECGTATVTHNSTGLSDGCGATGTETVTFTLTDECGNDITKDATFTIIDNTDPTWTVEPSDMTSVACDPATNATAFENWLASFSGTDECGTATVTHNSTGLSDGCGATGTETVTFTLTDECGNDITKDATFTIIDDTDPTWTVEPSDMTSVACDPATNATAFENWLTSFSGTDECGTATVTHNSTGLSDGCGATGTETVTFTLTDECGNDITKDATFTIIDDTDPTWTVEPSDMTSVACDPATNATAFENWLASFSGTDECGTATVTHNSTGLSDGCGATGTETVTFTLTDECGNDITKDATFTIIDDTDPTWTVEPSDMTSVACDPATNATAFENWLASFSGTDECGTATVTHNSTGLSDGCGATGTETVTFTLTDECGNDITKDATFTIIDDTDPTWTVEPSDMTSVACDPATNATAFENWLASFSGTDECGTATVTHNSTGLSDGCGATGTETVTFTLTDECGNDITKDATFTIIDNTDPIWTVEPSDMTSVACDPATNATAFENWLASFSGTDECGTATVTHNSTGLSDGCGATGTETVTFTLTDECGNDITKDATFTIIDDTDPTWTVEPSDMTSVACDPATNATAFENWLASFSGTDECGTATVTHNSTGLSDGCGATGTETVTFTLTDECGNDITKDATFTIIDDTDPTWTVEPSDMTSVACDPATNATAFENWLASFSGTDECGTATVTHNSTGLSDGCGATGTETVTFTLTDECGNDITKDATFTIIDDTDPTWTVEPSDMTSVACDPATNATAFENWLASFSGTDECGTATVTHNSTGLSDGCGATGTETVTFTLTDECGNDITKDATFTIIDDTDPIIDNTNLTNIEIECGIDPASKLSDWLASNAGATATDVCGGVTWSNNYGEEDDVDCDNGAITVIFTAT